MSADSGSQQQDTRATLWQDFVVNNIIAERDNGLTRYTHYVSPSDGQWLGAAAAAVDLNAENNNNNYINFNQFMMQHNYFGGGGGGGDVDVGGGDIGSDNGFGNGNEIVIGSCGGGGNAFDGGSPAIYNGITASPVCGSGSNGFYNDNSPSFHSHNGGFGYLQPTSPATISNTMSNVFARNGDGTGSGGNYLHGGGADATTTIAIASDYSSVPAEPGLSRIYDNLYTPFGNCGNSGTTYFANPFATGLDLGDSVVTTSRTSKFVPLFNKLAISEKHHEDDNRAQEPEQCPQVSAPAAVRNAVAITCAKDGNSDDPASSPSAQQRCGTTLAAMTTTTTTTTCTTTATLPVSHEPIIKNSLSIIHDDYNNSINVENNNDAAPTRTPTVLSNGLDGIGHAESPPRMIASLREREKREQRRFPNGWRSIDYHEREERYERSASGRGSQRERYDNYRSNKRRDDWNRNRDRINGFRVEEKFSMDNGKESPLPPSPEKKSPKKTYATEHRKLSQREKLIRDIETRRLECLVCVEPIKARHAVWSCTNCYHVLHLQCIVRWASSSRSDDGWRCPACQNVVKEVPRDYTCFCGKLKNPPYNRQDIAHSCGKMCGRIEGCAHACTLLCHPGPCPPCQANVKRECGCGRTKKLTQCYLKEPFQCDAICERKLNCGAHDCTERCHAGACPACKELVDQKCYCSKHERQIPCTSETNGQRAYSCAQPCERQLGCSNHNCKEHCHPGECQPCPSSPEVITSCPCGKVAIADGLRTSCLDPIPVCGGVCGKTLPCGKSAHPHHCTSKCHIGNCPPCNKQTAVKCRCGHMDQMMKCRLLSTRADDARCKKRCVKKRSCGKHKCNQECCIDIDHICPLPCNYTLSCGKHKCDQPCHRGNCPPCYRSSFEELYCECGAEFIYPPIACGTKRPLCKRPCSRPHPCQHPPQHNCHSAATCPPCMMFTTKWCYGKHEQRKTIPCSQESFSCGLACNKPLPCGRHKCIRPCHDGVCQLTPNDLCKQSCTAQRASCGHKCMAPCHEGHCPETQCKEMVEVQCECNNRKQMRLCHDLAREYSRITTAQLASSMAEMQRGNYMELSEILAPVKANKTLDCNEECRILERNRRLAVGLQIRNPDVSQKLLTKYSDYVRNFTKRDPTLVKSVHDALTNLVKLAKESKQKSRSHSFPIMNREKRQLVHEMCEVFGVESVAYDAEPNRNVVATAHRGRSWLPATSVMEVIQRESGQRRVPVPSNNAWGNRR